MIKSSFMTWLEHLLVFFALTCFLIVTGSVGYAIFFDVSMDILAFARSLITFSPPYPTLPDSLLVDGIYIFSTSIGTSAIVVWYFKIRRAEEQLMQHLAGPILLKDRQATKHFAKVFKKEDDKGLKLHPKIPLSLIRESGNVFCWGMQGAGKSNFIKALFSQIKQRQEPALIYDIKGEYTELFLDEKSCLLSPGDARTVDWNLSDDLKSQGMAEVFAEAVLPDGATNESFWTDSARTILIGIIVGLNNDGQRWSWSELNEKLFLGEKELKEWLSEHHKPSSLLINEQDKTTASIRSMLSTKLSWIQNLTADSYRQPKSFSITKWLSGDEPKTLIVQGNLTAPLMSAALITALMAIMTNSVLARPDGGDTKIWLIIDELGNLNKSKSLERWLSLGRSKNCRTIAGTQVLSQLYDIYGIESANTLLGLFNNIVAFKLAPSGDAAEKASATFGQQRVKYRAQSTNPDGENSYSYHQEMVPVVRKEDLIHLPQPTIKDGIKGFLIIGGATAVYQLTWPISNQIPKIAPPVVKKEVTKPSKKESSNRLNRRTHP